MKRILWFRRDLRVEDNPLLSLEGEVFPIFIFDTNIYGHLLNEPDAGEIEDKITEEKEFVVYDLI